MAIQQRHKTAAWAQSKAENKLSIIVHNNPQAVADFLHENYNDIPEEMTTKEIYTTCMEIANESDNPGEWVHNLSACIIYNPKGEDWTLINE